MPHPNINSAALENLRPLIEAANGFTLSQVCSITGLEPSTIQNWVKRGFVARPVHKKYRERQIARILLITYIRDSMKIESIGALMETVNGNADDESDDIIPEERLLGYFCDIAERAKDAAAQPQQIERLVCEAVKDYVPPSDDAYHRLTNALTVMAYAYIASEYKQLAEERFAAMQKLV